MYRSNSHAAWAAAADVNADGIDDLISGDDGLQNGSGLRVRLGSRNGALGTPVASSPPDSFFFADLQPVDLNGDPYTDLVAVSGWVGGDGNAEPRAMLGDGHGRFRVSLDPGGRHYPDMKLATIDLDTDGHQDIVAAGDWNDRSGLRFLRGSGDGRFSRTTIVAPGLPHDADAWPVAGDLDGDGHTDLVLASGEHLFALRFAGPSRFEVHELPRGPEDVPVAAADVDQDGRDEVLLFGIVDKLLRLARYGSAATTAVSDVRLDYFNVRVGDVTGDGRPDIVDSTTREAAIFPGTGARPIFLPGAGNVAIGDFNADGRLDIAAVGRRVEVFSAGTSPPGARRLTIRARERTAGSRRRCYSFRVTPRPIHSASQWTIRFAHDRLALNTRGVARACMRLPAGTHLGYLLHHGRTAAAGSVEVR